MYEFKACRICLGIGVRMFEIQGFIGNYLNELLGHEIVNSADFPPYICYECAYLLKKCIKFKKKCLLGQNVLLDILQRNKQVTKKSISLVDRVNLVSPLKTTSIPTKCCCTFKDTADCDDIVNGIKQENKSNSEDKAGTSHDPEINYDEHTILDDSDDDESSHEENGILDSHCSFKKNMSFDDNHPRKEEKDSEEDSSVDDYDDSVCLSEENKDLDSQLSIEEYDSLNDNKRHKGAQDSEDYYDVFIKAKEDCVICQRKLNAFEFSKMQQPRSIETLKKFSLLRNDKLFPFFNSVQELYLHKDCRRIYTRTRSDGKYEPLKPEHFLPKVEQKINKQVVQQKPKKRCKRQLFSLPSSQDVKIDYSTHCFICLKDAKFDKRIPSCRRNKNRTAHVSTSEIKDSVINYLIKLKDPPSVPNVDENIKRIKDLDLVNIPGRYHINCFARLRSRSTKKDCVIGRPQTTEIKEAMDIIYSYMEEMYDGSEFTVEELSGIVPGYVPSKRTIITKLKDHFQDRIEIIRETGKRTALMLKY